MASRQFGLRTIQSVSALLIAEILLFSFITIPEHAAELSSHDTCEICAFIHHPPILQNGKPQAILLIFRGDLVPFMAALPEALEFRFESGPSRAPPSLSC